MSAAGLAVGAVICAHNARYACLDGFFKRRQIGFKKVVRICNCVKALAVCLGTRMHRKML